MPLLSYYSPFLPETRSERNTLSKNRFNTTVLSPTSLYCLSFQALTIQGQSIQMKV